MAEINKNTLLKKLQSYNFAATDMLLYLDTHPDDTKAFSIYKELVAEARSLMDEYRKKYGPLTAFDAALSDKFNWIDSPWPWEKEAN